MSRNKRATNEYTSFFARPLRGLKLAAVKCTAKWGSFFFLVSLTTNSSIVIAIGVFNAGSSSTLLRFFVIFVATAIFRHFRQIRRFRCPLPFSSRINFVIFVDPLAIFRHFRRDSDISSFSKDTKFCNFRCCVQSWTLLRSLQENLARSSANQSARTIVAI